MHQFVKNTKLFRLKSKSSVAAPTGANVCVWESVCLYVSCFAMFSNNFVLNEGVWPSWNLSLAAVKKSLTFVLLSNLLIDNAWTWVSDQPHLSKARAAWKVSKYGVISGPYFPAFGLNTERYEVPLRIQFECGKIRTRNHYVFGHFPHSEGDLWIIFE